MPVYTCKMIANLLLITKVVLLQITIIRTETVQIDINDGPIIGKVGYTIGQNNKYFAYQGIPFAEPPVRFKRAVRKQPWTEPLDCTADRSRCVQGIPPNPITGSEDCLFLSVYTINLTGNYPVLVWIHGGGFIFGSNTYEENGPDFLLDEEVVIVIPNYRLGIFGFMSTYDAACPGNLGMKDQVLALEWVQKNIAEFGGDRRNVTIMGLSAGAAAVSYHLQSNMSKGLFHRAGMMSGTTTCTWSLNRRARKTAFAVGAGVGVVTTDSTQLVNGLRTVDYKFLQEQSMIISSAFTVQNVMEGLEFGPVDETEGDKPFFTGRSETRLASGDFHKVPVIVGVASNEGGGLVDPLNPGGFALFEALSASFDANILNYAPIDLTTDPIDRATASKHIKLHYFGLAPQAASPKQSLRFLNVNLFYRPVEKFVVDVSDYTDTYYYMFSYTGILTGNKTRLYGGAEHAEDAFYVLSQTGVAQNPEDQLIRERLVKMFCSFIKTGKPIPKLDPLFRGIKWLPASRTSPPYMLNIDTNMTKIDHPNRYDFDFYGWIYKTFGQGNYSTY